MERRQKRVGILMAALAVLLLCAMFLTIDTADAAVKYQFAGMYAVDDVDTLSDLELERIKEAPTGGYYLAESNFESQKKYFYYATALDGKKVKFATVSLSDSLPYNGKVLTNGSKIYYSLKRAEKGRIYCGSIDGSKPKLLKTVSLKGNDEITLLGIYNGSLYFQTGDINNVYSQKTPLYRLNLKSKELKKVSVNFNATYGYASGNGRYLYGSSVGKDGIRVFDCKTNKIIRTLTGGLSPYVDGGKLFYYTHSYEKNYNRIYRASLSGATRELLLEIPVYNATVEYMGADVVCYQTWAEGVEQGFHVYTVATGEDKVVDMDHAGEEGYKTRER
ncbi:MAG: hypothetical protein ACI4WY_08240 [Anaerovoracaceae bacterium]